MNPRMQSAGTAGIVAGVSLAILFILFVSSGVTPQLLADPAKGLAYVGQNAGRLRLTTIVSLVAVAFAVVFVAGLAAKLRDKTPTRATAVLYFGILALAGHALGTLIFGVSFPMIAAYAAKDPVAASHAWVAALALDGAADGLGNLFVGLSTLIAGWAITSVKALSPTLGWFAVVSGVVGVLAFLSPNTDWLFFLSFLFPIVWLLWAGSALRKAT